MAKWQAPFERYRLERTTEQVPLRLEWAPHMTGFPSSAD
jgi:hypothetical protein